MRHRGDLRAIRRLAVLFFLAMALMRFNANAQAVRYDNFASTTSAQCAPGKQCPISALPGTIINLCTGTAATLSACLASPATTYTDSTLGTPCPTTAQLTPATGGACLSTADNQGSYGFWASSGQYSYYLRVPATAGGGTYGPYPLNIGASTGCPSNATCDANYATIALACSAAGSGTLYVTRAWNGLATQTLACNMDFLSAGKLQPASGQTVTISGVIDAPLSQIFDVHLGGSISIASSVQGVPPQWFALCDNSTPQYAQLQSWLNSSPGLAMPKAPACMTSAQLQTGFDNQTITGQGAGNANSTHGVSIIRTVSGVAPVFAIMHYGVHITGVEFDGNGMALYGMVAACGANGLLIKVQIRGATSDNLRITNTDAGYTTCEGSSPSNNSLEVDNSSIYGSIGGNGVNMTSQGGDQNNNDVILFNDQVNANHLNGGLLTGTSGKVIGGDWSNNGVNSDTTQSYCIYLGPGTGASAVNWEINNPDIETCNFNPVTGLYKGPQAFMGNFSQANVWTSPGQASGFCNTAGCYLFSVGSNIWKAEFTGGINQIVGSGGAFPNQCLFDEYFTLPYPSWCIQNGVGGGIMTAAIHSGGGGSGYVVGNEVFVTQSGGSDGALKVTSVDGGGAVTGLLVIGNPYSGQNYTTATGLATSGGSGTGLMVDITAPYPGHNLPIAYGLRSNYQGVVQVDSNGLQTSVGNAQYSTCQMTVADNNIPQSCIHPIIKFQATGNGIALNAGPIAGEHHEICNGFSGTNSLNVQSHYLNLVGGSVTGPQASFFTAVNQCLTITFNGVGALVTTSGSTLTWVYGSQQFLTTWTGNISINGGVYTISSCSTVTTCTTTVPIGSFQVVPFTGPGDWDVEGKTF